MKNSTAKISHINLTTENLESLVFHPDEVLKDFIGFWETNCPQKLTQGWAKMANYEIPYDKFEGQLREWANLSKMERESDILYQNAREIIAAKDAFLPKALAHLHTFFPPETDLSVAVHLTAFNPSRAFAYQDIVINVQAPYWKGNSTNILNTIVHEIGHVGHSYYRTLWTEEKAKPGLKHKIMDNINSEGICTYIGYLAQAFAPAPNDQDYPMIDNPQQVKTAFAEVNHIFSQIGILPDADILKIGWDQGVMGRSYYVVGTTICKVIDEQLGRKALIQAMSTGPQFWARQYNQIAGEQLQLQFE